MSEGEEATFGAKRRHHRADIVRQAFPAEVEILRWRRVAMPPEIGGVDLEATQPADQSSVDASRETGGVSGQKDSVATPSEIVNDKLDACR